MTLKETTSFHHETGQHTISTVLTARGKALRKPLASKLKLYDLSYLRKIWGKQDIPLEDSKKRCRWRTSFKVFIETFFFKKETGPACAQALSMSSESS